MADVTLPDNLTAGTIIAGIDVTMSDGSQFIGDLAAEPAAIVTITAGNLVLARNLSPADVGPDIGESPRNRTGIPSLPISRSRSSRSRSPCCLTPARRTCRITRPPGRTSRPSPSRCRTDRPMLEALSPRRLPL